jgi:hypothetical protein
MRLSRFQPYGTVLAQSSSECELPHLVKSCFYGSVAAAEFITAVRNCVEMIGVVESGSRKSALRNDHPNALRSEQRYRGSVRSCE